MAAPYSLDLRERVVAAVAAGMSRKRAAAHYQVSHSSAIRWTRRQAESGSPVVAVGTRLTPRPPHRSEHALLTHSAPASDV